MDNHLQFKIGSTFSSEGFDKLSSAAKQSAGTVSRVTSAAGDLAEKVIGVDKGASQLVKTGGRLLSGFLSMGVWGAIIGAASALVGWITKIFEEEKKSTEELERMNNAWMTAEGRAAAYAKRVSEMRAAAKEAADAEKAAAEASAAAQKKALDAMKEKQKALDKIAATQEQIAALEGNGPSSEQQAVNDADRRLTYELSFGNANSQSVARAELELAQAKLAKAMQTEAAEREAAAATAAAERAEQKRKFEDMKAAMEEEIAQKQRENEEKNLDDAKKRAAKSTEAVAVAQNNLKNAIEAYKDNIAQNEVNRTIQQSFENAGNPGLTNFWGDLIANRGNIQQAAADVAVERGLADGTIRTVEQMRRTRNAAAKAANQAIDSKETNQQIKEDERASRIADTIAKGREKSLSKADKEFWEDRNKAAAARLKQQDEIAKRQKELEEAKKLEKQSFKDIADIKKKLDNLGLK